MYNEWTDHNEDLDPEPLMTTSLMVPMYGRDWRFDIQNTNAIRIAQSNNIPALTLVCGLVLNGLLFFTTTTFVALKAACSRSWRPDFS